MDDRQAMIVVVIFLVLFICVAFTLYRIMGKRSLMRERRGLALTAESLTQALPLPDENHAFLFSILVNGRAFSSTHFVVKDSENKQIAIIRVLRVEHPIMRRIEYQGKVYECTDTMNKLKSKIDLHEQGKAQVLMHMERNIRDETYSLDGKVKYINGNFSPKGSVIEINARSVGAVKKLKIPLDVDGLMISTDKSIPVLHQLFILSLTYPFS